MMTVWDRDERLFHGSSLWWRLVPKLRLVDMLFHHNFLYLEFFFFFFLNVVFGQLSNGLLNFCIKWKDGWILRSKPLHELDKIRQLQPLQYCYVDLQSPALPLGHVAKTIQKIYENIPYFSLWIGYISSIDCIVSGIALDH
jgi:hypothetical protein